MKLIDKDVLVEEIERRQKEEVSYDANGAFASWADENHYSILEAIKSFLDTIEVKDVKNSNNAFIENARKWFQKSEHFDFNGIRRYGRDDFEDFRKYMKGD